MGHGPLLSGNWLYKVAAAFPLPLPLPLPQLQLPLKIPPAVQREQSFAYNWRSFIVFGELLSIYEIYIFVYLKIVFIII